MKKLQKLKIAIPLLGYWIIKLSFTKEFNASGTINLNLLRTYSESELRETKRTADKLIKILPNNLYRVIQKSLRDFRTRLRNNQDRHGRKEHINR